MKLKPVLWDAPGAPYHGKPSYADHIFLKTNFEKFRALTPSEARKQQFICPDCGRRVAWVTSKRTGRPYLCDVKKVRRSKYSFTCYFDPSKPHFKSCSKTRN